DVVNIYGPASWHGFRPTDLEFAAYFDEVLKEIKHPVALAPNPVIGYTPRPALIADTCQRHSQVVSINLSGLGDGYFIELKNALRREVEIYVPYQSSLHMLTFGATGLLGAEANIIPQTCRRYIDLYEKGDYAALGAVYSHMQMFTKYVAKWH